MTECVRTEADYPSAFLIYGFTKTTTLGYSKSSFSMGGACSYADERIGSVSAKQLFLRKVGNYSAPQSAPQCWETMSKTPSVQDGIMVQCPNCPMCREKIKNVTKVFVSCRRECVCDVCDVT